MEYAMFALSGKKLSHYFNSPKKSEQGPPNLDELFAQLLRKAKVSKKAPSGSGPSKQTPDMTQGQIKLFLGLLVFLWVVSGIFIVAPQERAVVLQFGKQHSVVGPGPHWIPTFVRSKTIVNVQQIYTYNYQAEMLTKDENIVDVALSIQYRIGNAFNYLYKVVDPFNSLSQATASALRQVVGHTDLDSLLTSGRVLVRDQVESQLVKTLANYKPGLEITAVNLQPAQPPKEVTEAFDDAIKAREDEQRYINEAQAYARKVIPIAKGRAARILQQSKAEKEQYILNSEGQTAGFLALLPQHKRAPKVMEKRLYFAAMDHMFKNSSKVLVDAKAGNQMLYLPLDKLFERSGSKMQLIAPKNQQPLTQGAVKNTATGSSSSINSKTRLGRWLSRRRLAN
jgi:modulator of FtsH protease HflK